MARLALLLLAMPLAAQPLALLPANPHYFVYRGKPTVLVTSGEHYGAVLNGKFDYRKYLDTLAADGLNHTRIFTGLYREAPGSFHIASNTLAPEAADFISPLVRDAAGVYDLTAWNAAYFAQLGFMKRTFELFDLAAIRPLDGVSSHARCIGNAGQAYL